MRKVKRTKLALTKTQIRDGAAHAATGGGGIKYNANGGGSNYGCSLGQCNSKPDNELECLADRERAIAG